MMMIMMKNMMYGLRYIINNYVQAEFKTIMMHIQRIIARDNNVNGHCDNLLFRNSSLSTNNIWLVVLMHNHKHCISQKLLKTGCTTRKIA